MQCREISEGVVDNPLVRQRTIRDQRQRATALQDVPGVQNELCRYIEIRRLADVKRWIGDDEIEPLFADGGRDIAADRTTVLMRRRVNRALSAPDSFAVDIQHRHPTSTRQPRREEAERSTAAAKIEDVVTPLNRHDIGENRCRFIEMLP